jgi:hypothetical protein
MQQINIIENFPIPVENLFSYLEVHENLEALFFPLKVKTIKGGNEDKYGVGSVRSLFISVVPPFEETVTKYIKNEIIEYKITKGGPLKDHHGVMKFSSTANGSQLNYSIQFDSSIPFLAILVKFGLEKGILKGLKGLKKSDI